MTLQKDTPNVGFYSDAYERLFFILNFDMMLD